MANDANEPGLQVKCEVDTFSLLSKIELFQFGALNDAIQEDACGHIPEPLRDNGDPKRSGIGRVLLSCFAGVLKGIFQSFYDSIKSILDIPKIAKQLFGFVGEKAFKIAKALYKGGVAGVVNEFTSSSGAGFFAKLKSNFIKIFNSLTKYFANKVKDIYQCYSPVAKGEVVCNALAYLGTEFFSGFLFKAVGAVGKVASKASDLLGLPGVVSKLGKYAKGTLGAHKKLVRFLNGTGPRAIRKALFKADGLKKIVVNVNKAMANVKKKYRYISSVIKNGNYAKLGTISTNITKLSDKYSDVNKNLTKLNKALANLRKRIDAKEMNAAASRGSLKDMREEAVQIALQIEKNINKAKVLGQKLENTLVLADTANLAINAGTPLETFLSGVSIDGSVLAGPFQR
tara:strand:+ start:47252 stop:48451 length:1200 start_codon:yes stop_codon:yes gene_type:complete